MHHRRAVRALLALAVVCGTSLAGFSPARAEPAHKSAGSNQAHETYGDVRRFLKQHTKVVELTTDEGARVAICPQYQGRVMTSTASGEAGPSFGWINRDFIAKRAPSKQFNNYGGEDRFWLGPEGGQFSLWFAPGAEQKFDNWFTPPALNDGAFQVDSKQSMTILLSRRMRLQNASGTRFDLDVERRVRLLSRSDLKGFFGRTIDSKVVPGLKIVGFATQSAVINRGRPMRKKTGLVSIWVLGMFPPGAKTQIALPYRSGSQADLGPIVKSDYFGAVPAERLTVTKSSILFSGDGRYRSKIGVSQRRALPVAASIDRTRGVLTLVHFSMPPQPAKKLYVNNSWDLPQRKPYVGDVVNSYNDGPPSPDKPALGGFYELETLSPAAELNTGDRLTHQHATFHIHGPVPLLEKILEEVLRQSGSAAGM